MIDSCLGKIACAESAHSNRDRLPVASGAEPLFSYTTSVVFLQGPVGKRDKHVEKTQSYEKSVQR